VPNRKNQWDEYFAELEFWNGRLRTDFGIVSTGLEKYIEIASNFYHLIPKIMGKKKPPGNMRNCLAVLAGKDMKFAAISIKEYMIFLIFTCKEEFSFYDLAKRELASLLARSDINWSIEVPDPNERFQLHEFILRKGFAPPF